MEVKPFTPNYITNRGKDFGKNGNEAGPGTKKKRTEIPGAIKTADEVEARLAKAGKKVKGARKNTKAKGRKMPGLWKPAGLSRARKASCKIQESVGE